MKWLKTKTGWVWDMEWKLKYDAAIFKASNGTAQERRKALYDLSVLNEESNELDDLKHIKEKYVK